MPSLNLRIGPMRERPPLRGQSLVEFALTLPLLLIFLLGIADLGRVFSQGIILEAAARNGAEAAAQEYVQLDRNQPGGLTAADYARLHQVAASAVCEEAERLPNFAGAAGSCSMPYAAVCVHDAAAGDQCGSEAAGAPADCSLMDSAWAPGIEQVNPSPPLPYVEVRVCYRFTTLMNISNLQLPFGWSLTIGDIWLQRDRSFVAGTY